MGNVFPYDEGQCRRSTENVSERKHRMNYIVLPLFATQHSLTIFNSYTITTYSSISKTIVHRVDRITILHKVNMSSPSSQMGRCKGPSITMPILE